jgi:hypothetical protein
VEVVAVMVLPSQQVSVVQAEAAMVMATLTEMAQQQQLTQAVAAVAVAIQLLPVMLEVLELLSFV